MVRTSAPPAHRMASVLHGARRAHGPLGIAHLEASHALGCNGPELIAMKGSRRSRPACLGVHVPGREALADAEQSDHEIGQ